MTTARRLLAIVGSGGLGLCVAGLQARALAESADLQLIKGGATPAAIQGMPSRQRLSCPLLVKPGEAGLQPLSIAPDQVTGKNRLGCLSSSDAIYGPDGCPNQLCGPGRGVIPLPPGSSSSAAPQLPAP
jgi:hypothetical protein